MKHVEHIFLLEVRARHYWTRFVYDTLLTLGGVVLVTGMLVATLFPLRIPVILLAYLLVILILASTRGQYAAFLAALLATGFIEFFFFPHPNTFAVFEDEDMLTLLVFLATAIMTSQLVSFLRRRAEQARRRERELRLLYQQAQELAALHERQRLARELHDSVSQALYSISLGAHSAREALDNGDSEQARASVDYVLALTEAGLAEMRTLIFELRPESLETEGLVAALTRQVAVLRARHRLIVETELADEPHLSLERKHALYRIAQEALHNIIKHAHASVVVLRLTQQQNKIVLEVRDNGKGFDPQGHFPGHLGLHSMHERATKAGGTLTIESTPGQGTYLCVQFT